MPLARADFTCETFTALLRAESLQCVRVAVERRWLPPIPEEVVYYTGGVQMDSLEQNDGPEALGWLRQDPPPLCFHWNKCGESVAWAVTFVEGLYALGSPRVVVPRWSIRQVAPKQWRAGGVEACAFGVHLPENGPAREALIWFCAACVGDLRMSFSQAKQLVGAEFVVLARI